MKKAIRKKNKPAKTLITGNEAIGEAAAQAGCRFYAGYPITPQNELTAYMARRMNEVGGVFIQAESEIAAINMVFGASATGFRAMTSSSSPGISLKQEGISYCAGAELPCVVINVMRAGPGLGNITPSQSDYFQAVKGGGHGDYRLIVLAPSSVSEAFALTGLAFDLADKYRTPAMILTDAYLGQMAEPVEIDFLPAEPARIEKPWALTGAKNRPANIIRSLMLKEGVLEAHNKHLQEKFRAIGKNAKRFFSQPAKKSDILCVAYGSAYRIAQEAAQILADQGIGLSLFRPISLWPFPEEALQQAARNKKAVLVCEFSGGQMKEDVQLTLKNKVPVHFYGSIGGAVFTEKDLAREIKKIRKRHE